MSANELASLVTAGFLIAVMLDNVAALRRSNSGSIEDEPAKCEPTDLC